MVLKSHSYMHIQNLPYCIFFPRPILFGFIDILGWMFESYGGGDFNFNFSQFFTQSYWMHRHSSIFQDGFDIFDVSVSVLSKPSIRCPFQHHLFFTVAKKKKKIALTQKEGLDKFTYLLICKLNGICPSLSNIVPAGHRHRIPLHSRHTISLVSQCHQL